MNKKIISFVLALAMVFSLLPGLGISASAAETADTYTYDAYITEAPTNWSPMSWASNGDEFVRFYTQTPLVEATVKNSATGEYQWAFLAAVSVTDVTAEVMPDAPWSCVYDIALNPELCWADGTPITADTYIYSMQQILDPEMRYARAADFIDGGAPLAGAEAYYFAGSVTFQDNGATGIVQSEADLVLGDDGNYYTADGAPLYIALTTGLDWLGNNSLKTYVDAYGGTYFDMEAYGQLEAQMDENGNVVLNDTTLALLQQTISTPNWGETPAYFFNYLVYSITYPEANWNTVGLTKVDEYTIRYTCANPCSYFYFMSAFSGSNWLIHEELYESCKAAGTYGTSPETTMSYGPYQLQSADASGVVLVRNENHFEYTANAAGILTSMTSFQVDGASVPQWQMDTVTAQVLTDEDAEQYFLAGDLDIWKMPGNSAPAYTQSPALYQATHQTTYSLMLNTNLETLQNMDASYGTTNAAVLSNHNFRRAFSLATNRYGLNLGGVARTGALGLINDTFYYDAEYNTASVYRKSDAAMRGICDLYGVTYGAGTPYATLEEAYASIDGYDPDQARKLMALACDELVAEGLYTRGQPIVLTYAVAAASDRTDKILSSLAEIFNAAAEGSGFGTIAVEARVSGWNWSSEIREGKAAMVLGGWSGSALNPFTIMELYLDPNYAYTPLNMDVDAELLTLNISGKDYTMSWLDWAQALGGASVENANTDFLHNVEALAKLESAYLQLMYAIPIASDADNYLLGYQVDYYTDEYNAMYGFGGERLMTFRYTDAEWDAYVASGKLDYSTGCGDTHSYEAAVTEPTCTEKGFTSYTCSACGHSYTGSYVDALGHSYEGGVCTACGEEDPDYVEAIASGWTGVNQWILTDDGVLTVYGQGKMKNYGYTGTQPWLSYKDQIKSIVIEQGVTAIGTGAFMNLIALESITLPDSGLNTIGEAAFYGCTSLKEIYIPDGIYTIWNYTFKGCSALENVRLPKSLIKIDQGAFENCTALPYLFVPTNVNIIGSWSFKGCAALAKADLQWADATEIREGAFKNCTSLTTIILPSNIQKLGDSCFYGIGAESFSVPATVTEIAPWCFARAKLTKITFLGDAPTIGRGAFNKITLTAYYPATSAGWTAEIMQNYGGTVSWQGQ